MMREFRVKSREEGFEDEVVQHPSRLPKVRKRGRQLPAPFS
jgi:hypothetical protein